ncbi:integrin alpha [Nitrosomonas ureae]|uniref:FG-GAP repeat-containing protein n=1 Tax=Nitrosomonas ureae TaxID=44577 RepID=A0A1H5USP3_9PROT|nr:integrin alpha [Nitrosomonas ureae]SEF78142.1 FG-GAP repeat-containing protein [Nitrosomonas ureae]
MATTTTTTTTIINLSSLDGNNGFRLDGTAYDGAGSVSNAGDVNSDGFADLIVGASGADPNGDFSGSSYVVFGKAAGFDATTDLSSLDGNNGFRLDGVATADLLGISVSSAGDVNGDGIADVIVGASGADPNGTLSAGSSYVVFGKVAGFDATLDLSSLDGSNGLRLDGVAAGDRAGFPVSGAGDVNGDGIADVIVGASGADPNGTLSAGSSYVVFGKASGFSATLDLSSLDGNNGFRLDGTAIFDLSGFSVSNAGDVNGDGFADVIIGAQQADVNGYDSAGSSYVVFGKASGFDAALDLSSLDGSNGFRLDGAADNFSGNSVSSAGDINGDGFADLIVGAFASNPNGAASGSSYVVFGKASGFDATLDLSSLDGNNGFRLDGAAAYDYSGTVSSAGDVNGDGFADLIVGAIGADSNGNNSGSSYVVFGKAAGFSATLDLSSLDSNDGFRLDGAEQRRMIKQALRSAVQAMSTATVLPM